MFDVTIYYKDGRRSFYDHVDGLHDNGATVGISLLTDFSDRFYKNIPAEEIDSMRVKVIMK